MMRKVLFGIGILAFLVLFTACHQADASTPTATPTVTPVVTVAPTPTATAKPTPTATPIPTPTLPPEAFAELVLEKVNNARIENGLETLEMSPSLCAAAVIRADELRQKSEAINDPGYMNNILTRDEMHSRLDGDSFGTVIDEIGITNWDWAGENVNYAKQSDYGAAIDSNRAFTAWKNSPDHWEAILYKNWTKTGIAVVYSNGIAYAVQLFTTGHTEAPEYANPSPTVTP
jgi:uncharacterized protein YkwD